MRRERSDGSVITEETWAALKIGDGEFLLRIAYVVCPQCEKEERGDKS